MKKLLFVLMLGAGLGLSGNIVTAENHKITGGDEKCIKTTDLEIKSGSLDFQRKLGIIKGKIYNSSEDVVYENVKLKVNFYDENDKLLGSETTMVKRDLKGGETDFFTEHVKTPDNVDHVSADIVCATVDTE